VEDELATVEDEIEALALLFVAFACPGLISLSQYHEWCEAGIDWRGWPPRARIFRWNL
jgi:hypothetical protein